MEMPKLTKSKFQQLREAAYAKIAQKEAAKEAGLEKILAEKLLETVQDAGFSPFELTRA